MLKIENQDKRLRSQSIEEEYTDDEDYDEDSEENNENKIKYGFKVKWWVETQFMPVTCLTQGLLEVTM